MQKIISIIFLIFTLLSVKAQEETKNKYKFFDKRPNKGKIFVCFGWNGAVYSNSNIHFEGKNYNFILKAVRGRDKQEKFDFGLYFGPTTITIPQYNFKIGYFFHNHYYASINVDHMKYVMRGSQKSTIDGYISNTNTKYDNTYSDADIILSPDFLSYEHTDGLNYINIEVNRFDDLLDFVKLDNKWLSVNLSEGLSAGLVIPKTNVTLLNNPRNDQFYLSGYGISGNVDVNITILQYFFVQYGLKAGFIDLPAVHTTNKTSDKASQNFWFLQYGGTFGLKIRIAK